MPTSNKLTFLYQCLHSSINFPSLMLTFINQFPSLISIQFASLISINFSSLMLTFINHFNFDLILILESNKLTFLYQCLHSSINFPGLMLTFTNQFPSLISIQFPSLISINFSCLMLTLINHFPSLILTILF